MKKRIIALLLSTFLLLTFIPFSASAESKASVIAENCSVSQGDYAYLYLRADNFVNVAAIDIELYYDSSVMSVYYLSNNSFLSSASVSTNTNTLGTIKISAMSLEGLTSTTNYDYMITVCFKIANDCPSGDYPVIVAVGHAYDNELNPANVSGINGVISVTQSNFDNQFPFYRSLSSTNVQQADVFTLQIYNYNYYEEKFASACFNVTYDSEILKIKSIELANDLLNEGAVYSINSANPGMAIITYATTNSATSFNVLTISFEVIANTDTETKINVISSDIYNDDLMLYSPTAFNATVCVKEKAIEPDYPDFKLQTENFVVGEPTDIYVVLEENAQVAAGDFVINYDKNMLTIDSVSADSNTLSNGALIVIDNNFSDGKIRFSYINQNGSFNSDTKLLKITATPKSAFLQHYIINAYGIDVCDINLNDVTLNYISNSGCIFYPTVVNPTCENMGYTLYQCRCGQSFTDNAVPPLGHSFDNWIVDKAETCGESGIKHQECSVCQAKINEGTIIPPSGNHTYDNSYDAMCNNCEHTRTTPADVNGDGVMDAADLARLKKYIAVLLNEEEMASSKPDVNQDGQADAADLAILKKVIAGLIYNC